MHAGAKISYRNIRPFITIDNESKQVMMQFTPVYEMKLPI